MSILEQIRELREHRDSNLRENLENITDTIEELLGPAEMWNISRTGFSTDELLENLEYIAKEADI